MRSQFEKLLSFFTEMESTSQKAIWISFALFSVAGIVLAFGMVFMRQDTSFISQYLVSVKGTWWAPLAVTAIFTILAFLGAPQFVLIAATVAVFGTSDGVIYSWVATMISASVGYTIGRIGGANTLKKLLSGRGARLINFIGNNGFWSALLVRQVPTGPFILVNLALGASNVRATWFLSGTGIGILPKILLIAFGAHGIGQMLLGENQKAIWFFLGALIIWLIIVFFVRPMVIKLQPSQKNTDE